MRIILDEIEGAVYGDLVISSKELERLKYGEMIEGESFFKYKRYYLGIRMQGDWDYEEEENDFWAEES